MNENTNFDNEEDARGLRCPLPVLRAARALRSLPEGANLGLLADDPMAVIDVPHFCAEAGHDLLSSEDRGDHHLFVIKSGTAAQR